jgi:cryptochrome
MIPTPGTAVYWFRAALRLHDNKGLSITAQYANHLCIYIIPEDAKEYNCGTNRWTFLMESLQDLSKQLEELGSKLVVLRGDPVSITKKLLDSGNSLI